MKVNVSMTKEQATLATVGRNSLVLIVMKVCFCVQLYHFSKGYNHGLFFLRKIIFRILLLVLIALKVCILLLRLFWKLSSLGFEEGWLLSCNKNITRIILLTYQPLTPGFSVYDWPMKFICSLFLQSYFKHLFRKLSYCFYMSRTNSSFM